MWNKWHSDVWHQLIIGHCGSRLQWCFWQLFNIFKKLHIVSVYCEFVTKLIYFLITCFHGVAYQNEIPSGWKLFWLWWNSYLSFPWHESAKSRILRGLCRWLRWGQLWACIVHSFFKMLLFESLMYTLSQKSSHLLTVCNFVKF